MRKGICSFVLCFLLSACPAGANPPGVTEDAVSLADVYRCALQKSESVAINKERVKESAAGYSQALSTALPKVSFVSSDTWQDKASLSTLKQHSPNRRFKFTQPLFSGFKEFVSMSAYKAEKQQRLFEVTQQELELLVEVSDVFYSLISQREDLNALQQIQGILAERARLLKERTELGRSKTSEVSGVESQLNRNQADVVLVRGSIDTTVGKMSSLTGLNDFKNLDIPYELPVGLEDKKIYLEKVKQRPDVLAAGKQLEVAQKKISAVKADFWPTVDIESNSYTQRPDSYDGVDWDVLLTVDVPIFQGGETKSKVRAAKSVANQAELSLQKTVRNAVLEIENNFINFNTALSRFHALKKAEGSAADNYNRQKQDYANNLVGNLDVLQSIQELQDIRRSVISAKYEVYKLYWKLKASIGETIQ